MKWGWRLLLAGFVVSSLTWIPDNWVFPFALGVVFSIIFLSVTLITGMAGQLSLCQATFAGVGGFAAGQMATHFGLPILLGAVLGGVCGRRRRRPRGPARTAIVGPAAHPGHSGLRHLRRPGAVPVQLVGRG